MPETEHPPRMKLWKADQEQWLARLVDGAPYPARDEEGDVCYDNTHFRAAADAWANLEANAVAGVKLAGRSVLAARERLRQAEADAADAAVHFQRFTENRSRMVRNEGGGDDD